jgi:glycerol-3-phosphate dehydrogenase
MKGLGPRASALERLAETSGDSPLDVLVIGGGVTGAGIALDAASRGMRVGLVERSDFASGTSSKSSKLVHGGLRYLEQREFGLVREASTERDLMMRLAPHLVEAIPFVLPVNGKWLRAKFGAGLWAYDALASFKNLRVHKHLDADETENLVPALPKDKIKGGFIFYDCKTDDVRIVMEVLVAAVRFGAVVANHTEAVKVESGEVPVVTVRDQVDGNEFDIYARRVVNAVGVWGDRVDSLAHEEIESRLRPSKGVHLVFSRALLPLERAAAFIPDAERKRMLFVIPWLDSVIVGTTDTPFEGDIDAPTVDEVDRSYCLDAVNSAFGLSLSESDIEGAYAGLRPLVAGREGATADLSRRHRVYDIAPGVIGITGGKLTTWRRMAKDAVDRLAEELGVEQPCKTQNIKLGSSDVNALRLAVQGRSRKLGFSDETVANLVRCYGDRALSVVDLAAESGAIGPLVEGRAPVEAEAIYCARAEMVVHLADLLTRRTRLALIDPAAGTTGSAASVLGAELGWSQGEIDAEVESHRSAIERERGTALRDDRRPVGATTG